MGNLYILLTIFIDFILLSLCYIFIVKRLKHITQKNIEYTKVDWLTILYNKLIKLIFMIIVVLFIVSVFIILTFL